MSISSHEPLLMVIGIGVELTDADGEEWRVTERDCRGNPGARGARCLVLMTDAVFRRVWVYRRIGVPSRRSPLSSSPGGGEKALSMWAVERLGAPDEPKDGQ